MKEINENWNDYTLFESEREKLNEMALERAERGLPLNDEALTAQGRRVDELAAKIFEQDKRQ